MLFVVKVLFSLFILFYFFFAIHTVLPSSKRSHLKQHHHQLKEYNKQMKLKADYNRMKSRPSFKKYIKILEKKLCITTTTGPSTNAVHSVWRPLIIATMQRKQMETILKTKMLQTEEKEAEKQTTLNKTKYQQQIQTIPQSFLQ